MPTGYIEQFISEHTAAKAAIEYGNLSHSSRRQAASEVDRQAESFAHQAQVYRLASLAALAVGASWGPR